MVCLAHQSAGDFAVVSRRIFGGTGTRSFASTKEMGALYFPVISLSVAVILFEGALTLTWREVRTVVSTVRNLLIVGSLVTWIGSALLARYLLTLPICRFSLGH